MRALLLALTACANSVPQAHGWTSTGDAPDGVDVAIEVVREARPDLPQGGWIVWSPGPFPCQDYSSDAEGCTFYDCTPITIEVMYREHVEDTALIYELGNLLHIAPDQSPELQAWADALRAVVRERMGR